jgi:hypothetical protein
VCRSILWWGDVVEITEVTSPGVAPSPLIVRMVPSPNGRGCIGAVETWQRCPNNKKAPDNAGAFQLLDHREDQYLAMTGPPQR